MLTINTNNTVGWRSIGWIWVNIDASFCCFLVILYLKQSSELPGREPEYLNSKSLWFVGETNQPETVETIMHNNTQSLFLQICLASFLNSVERIIHSSTHERKVVCSKPLEFHRVWNHLSHFCTKKKKVCKCNHWQTQLCKWCQLYVHR